MRSAARVAPDGAAVDADRIEHGGSVGGDVADRSRPGRGVEPP